MSLPDLLQHPSADPVSLYLTSLPSPASRRSMTASLQALSGLARDLSGQTGRVDWTALDPATATALRAACRSRWAPATTNRHMACLRGVVKAAWLAGAMDRDVAEACRAGLANVPAAHRGPDPSARLVTDTELARIFDLLATEPGPRARRDAALLAVLAQTGMRRSEVVDLRLSDLDGDVVLIRHGKGDLARQTWLGPASRAALDDWLAVRGRDDGPVFTQSTRRGLERLEPLSDHHVWTILRTLCQRSGLRAFAPHDLRRKLVSDLLDAGVDLSTVRTVVGHADVSTTARYDRRGLRAAQQASTHAHVPYRETPETGAATGAASAARQPEKHTVSGGVNEALTRQSVYGETPRNTVPGTGGYGVAGSIPVSPTS